MRALAIASAFLTFAAAAAGAPPLTKPAGALTLALSVSPDPLVLSTEMRAIAEVRVSVRDEHDRPAELPSGALRLGASVGTLSTPIPAGPGEYRATYTAPSQRFPQISILVARGPGDAVATRPLPLHARTNLEGRAERGGAVTAVVDGARFGPFPVSASGRFAVPVVVPPGGHAFVLATDRLGNERRREVDLHVPPFPRQLLVVVPEQLVADGRSQAEVLVASIDERGRPLATAMPRIETDAGTVSATVERLPGLASAQLTAPVEVGRGNLRIRAGSAIAVVTLLPGAPQAIRIIEPATVDLRLSVDPPAIQPGGRARVRIAIGAGSAPTGKLLAETSAGALVESKRDGRAIEYTLTAPLGSRRGDRIIVAVRDAGSGVVVFREVPVR